MSGNEPSSDEWTCVTPKDVMIQAQAHGVDPVKEPHLLWIFQQALDMPLPPHWTHDEQTNEFVNEITGERAAANPAHEHVDALIKRERAKSELPVAHAWIEFFDERQQPYYYDFDTKRISRQRPQQLCERPLPVSGGRGGGAGGGHVAGGVARRDRMPAKLRFRSWWNEVGAYGATRRTIDIAYNTRAGSFEVVIDGDDELHTISHVLRPHGKGVVEAYDLHIGACINILGRPTTLSHGSLDTVEWIDGEARRLRRVKRQLEDELRKYESRSLKCGPLASSKPPRRAVCTGGVCLRDIVDDIAKVRSRLQSFRPALAARFRE